MPIKSIINDACNIFVLWSGQIDMLIPMIKLLSIDTNNAIQEGDLKKSPLKYNQYIFVVLNGTIWMALV